MVSLISSPFGVNEMRVFCSNGEHQVHGGAPLIGDLECPVLLNRLYKFAELIFEINRENRKRTMDSIHIAIEKLLGYFRLWEFTWIDHKINLDAIAVEIEGRICDASYGPFPRSFPALMKSLGAFIDSTLTRARWSVWQAIRFGFSALRLALNTSQPLDFGVLAHIPCLSGLAVPQQILVEDVEAFV